MIGGVSNGDQSLGGLAGLGGAGPSGAMGTMGKEDFLKLLVAQLSQQDPLNPQDGAEFVAQLAQFSSVEQLMNIRGGLDTLALAQQASTSAQVVGFIGREVVALGDQVRLDAGAGEASFALGADAASVTVDVVNGEGKTVASVDGGRLGAGEQTVRLAGVRDADGNALEGDYTFRVRAKDAKGNAIDATTFTRGLVTGVTFENGYPELMLANGRRLSLADVVRVERESDVVAPVPAGGLDGDDADDTASALDDADDSDAPGVGGGAPQYGSGAAEVAAEEPALSRPTPQKHVGADLQSYIQRALERAADQGR